LSGGLIILTAGALFFFSPDSRFMVHFMDVGQGEAALVITPGRGAVLIDAGARGPYGDYDAGERVVLPYLKYYGIRSLDLLILSHGHNDHAGGAAAVAGQAPVRRLWLPKNAGGRDIERLLAASPSLLPEYMEDGQTAEVDGAVVKVLYAPDSRYTARKKTAETSAVVKISLPGGEILFTGDAQAAAEREIAFAAGRVSVLKVSHHGSGTASDPLFIAATNPSLAVISVGAGNSYGHPAAQTLDRLLRQGCAVLRTDQEGAVLVEIQDGRTRWFGYRRQPGAF
jgi:competence protein ComEC